MPDFETYYRVTAAIPEEAVRELSRLFQAVRPDFDPAIGSWCVPRHDLPKLLASLQKLGASDIRLQESRVHLLATGTSTNMAQAIERLRRLALTARTRRNLISGGEVLEFQGVAVDAERVLRALDASGIETVLAMEYYVEYEESPNA
jgi:hypothetical protein